MDEDTIAAIATPFGQGAIGVLRVSGARAKEVTASVLRRGEGPETMVARSGYLREVIDGEGDRVDEVLVTCFEGPASYTG